ncbi:hypothetical protein EV359DRAFT_62933 [Lentinula novae-zelandiae]|nr:hypothetical protein EV359DRAFT_62933 [Lentinula novae-zelandiae]
MHNDNFASQASDTPVVHANPDPSDRVDGQLDPQEFSFGDRASYGHGAYQDVEYEEGSTDGNYPIFTEEEGHMESTGSGKEGVQDGKMAPYYYPRSRHIDVPGPVLTAIPFHFSIQTTFLLARTVQQHFLTPTTIWAMPVSQPNHTPFDKAGAQDTGMPSDPDYYPGYADVPSPVVISDELARTSQGVRFSDNNLDNDIDTLRHVCTESSSYNDDPTPVNQLIQEKAMQKQEPADINVAMDVPLKDKADKAEADEDEKQGKQSHPAIEEEDTEDLGFSTLPPQFCNENISDPQADVPNSHIYPCDAASSEGTESYYSQSNSEDSSVLLEGGFDYHSHDVTKDPGAFCDHDAVNHPGSGAPGDLNQESQDSSHHTGLHGTDAGNEQGVSEDHHHPYQVNTIDKMQINDGLYKFVNDNTGPEDFETPNPHVNTTLNL